MARFLVYVSPAVGHTLPLVPGLLELQRRGHSVQVRTLSSIVESLRDAGLDAAPVSASVSSVEVTDFKASSDTDRLRAGQSDLMERGRHDGPDLAAAIAEFAPDAVLVDVNSYGARTVAEKSGLPFATLLPSVIPVPGKGIPPYGPGLKPSTALLGRLRDAIGWKVMERAFGKVMLPGLNELRRAQDLEPLDSPLRLFEPPYQIIATTAEPLEYPRADLPANVHLVGTQPWDVPAERPAWLDEPGDPWVLVTCSTEYQGDEDLAQVAAEALRDEPVRVLMTLADAYDESAVRTGGNLRVERFVPHAHVLPEAVAVVCHGGMGIVTKAASAGVPAVVVPFGRDQPEVARRVVECGAGVEVKPKDLAPERLRDAVRTARGMTDSARRVAERLDPAGSPAKFADAVLSLLGDRVPNGAH